MENLSERSKFLLCDGAKMCGSFVEGMTYHFEDYYVKEYEEAFAFAEWIDKEIGGASHHNIERLFLAFKNPNDKRHQEFAQDLKRKIEEINILHKK